MKPYYKLLLRPSQLVMLISLSDGLMEKCGEFRDGYDGAMSELMDHHRKAMRSWLKATDEYQRLEKCILSLSPDETRELKAIASVGDKKLRTADFVQECNRAAADNPLVQATYLMNETRLFESIQRGIAALTDDGVIEKGVFAEFDGGQ